jgi:two-component sensor histidine kinase
MLHHARTTPNHSPIIVEATAAAHLNDESRRVAAVKRYEILETPTEADFDRITGFAADLFEVPVSIIGFVDLDRIWLKSHHGLDAAEIDRDGGISALRSIERQIQASARVDVRSFISAHVAGETGLRFCIAVPLSTHDGHDLGALCVLDRVPILFDEQQIRHLKFLAASVMDLLERRLSARRAVAQAEVMAREIDHRTMNSLQFVASLLNLQSRAIGVPEAADQLSIAANRILAVARVHRHFANDEATAEVSILPYLRRLCSELSDILGADITVDGVEMNVRPTQLLALGLITHELVTNAKKHSAGSIKVTFTPAVSGEYELCVADEGDGLPEGFEPEQTSGGLGLKVVIALVSQLNGRLTAYANPTGRGACFTIIFPAL